MKRKAIAVAISGLFSLTLLMPLFSLDMRDTAAGGSAMEKDNLLVVWTSGDREVALKMVFMYTFNAKKNGWWKTVRFLIWGPSSRLLSEDTELQDYLAKMKEEDIELYACKACADSYPVTEQLEDLGVEVFYSGEFLANWIKSGKPVVTF